MPPGPNATRAAVDDLLRELPELRRGNHPREAPGYWPTGLAPLDRILGGGVPRGRLCEAAGPASSGRTSVALALLAATTGAGERAAVVDAADAFDPASAAAARVGLERTLWVRSREPDQALRAADLLVRVGGFAVVVLDLACGTGRSTPQAQASRGLRAQRAAGERSSSTWLRLSRSLAGSRTALVLLCETRVAGTWADLALELAPARPRFTGVPPLLESFESEARVVRNRTGPPGGVAPLRFRPLA